MYSEKNPDDERRNCPKHVEFYSKNIFEKLVHLIGFIIRMQFHILGTFRPSGTHSDLKAAKKNISVGWICFIDLTL